MLDRFVEAFYQRARERYFCDPGEDDGWNSNEREDDDEYEWEEWDEEDEQQAAEDFGKSFTIISCTYGEVRAVGLDTRRVG